MSGEDQERFEDYLELERYIEGLQEGRRVHPPCNLTPAQIRIYRMAALFRSATPGASEPDPGFVAALHDHLLSLDKAVPAEETDDGPTEKLSVVRPKEVQPEIPPRELRKKPHPERRRVLASLSRRTLIAGGAVAAASLAVGAGLGAALKPAASSPNPPANGSAAYSSTPLVPGGPNTTWHYVTTIAQMGKRAVQFSTGAVVGYVILNDGDDPTEKEQVIAFSAACTHMGCIVQWQESDRRFLCPCHGGVFGEYGRPANQGQTRYLASLPRLKTNIDEAGNIYVEVPKVGL